MFHEFRFTVGRKNGDTFIRKGPHGFRKMLCRLLMIVNVAGGRNGCGKRVKGKRLMLDLMCCFRLFLAFFYLPDAILYPARTERIPSRSCMVLEDDEAVFNNTGPTFYETNITLWKYCIVCRHEVSEDFVDSTMFFSRRSHRWSLAHLFFSACWSIDQTNSTCRHPPILRVLHLGALQ
jgi:hypothetical protein